MPLHAFIALAVAFLAGVYVDHKFATRAITKVRAEVSKMDQEFRDVIQYRERRVLARIKALL